MSDLSGSGQRQLVVVGAGSAGLYTALCAARAGAQVTLVSATELAESSSYWAQGGLAAALAQDDNPDLHLADTLKAGRGAVRLSAARVLVDEAPDAVEDLIRLGVSFDADRRGRLALGLEGGHSARRIVHAGGAATGLRLLRGLSAAVAKNGRIDLIEGRRVTALLLNGDRCIGVVLDGREAMPAAATVLATGGAAALWSRTTNPSGATGGGMLLAHRAGAKLADLELVQFHPTAVVDPGGSADGLLVTEAVRGEGAVLLGPDGERFVDELAPRDEVSRVIFALLRDTGTASVGLDMRDVDPALFPNVVSALQNAGLDPEREPIPVAPAAHYSMGGIATDLDARSSLPGLFAVGECSCTGLHGANRLASNSLTECFVFGARAARAALHEPHPETGTEQELADVAAEASSQGPPPALTASSREALWRHAGLLRDEAGLLELEEDPYPLVGLIAKNALMRRESRGAHQRSDFPNTDPAMDGVHVTQKLGQEPDLERWS